MRNIPAFEEIIGQIKINFRILGIPFEGPNSILKFLILFLTLAIVVAEEIAFFCSKISSENFLELTQLAPCTATGILSLLKIFLIFCKRHKVYKLTDCLENLYDTLKSEPTKINCVKDDVILTKTLIKYYFILNMVLISIYNFSSLLFIIYELGVRKEAQFHLPYFVLVPISVDNWFNWFIIYLHLIVGGFICILFFTTVDALYFILTSQVCINFSVLSNELEKLTASQDGLLNELIEQHQYILNLSDDLEDIFTGPNFYNVAVGSLSICALGFNLTTGDWAQIPGSILFLSSVLLQILMMSVFGENLSRESERIGSAVYHCKWYEMEQKSKKTILLIQERAKKTQRLTAYKFSVISYRSFSNIIRASWSYFTILRTVYKPAETQSSTLSL